MQVPRVFQIMKVATVALPFASIRCDQGMDLTEHDEKDTMTAELWQGIKELRPNRKTVKRQRTRSLDFSRMMKRRSQTVAEDEETTSASSTESNPEYLLNAIVEDCSKKVGEEKKGELEKLKAFVVEHKDYFQNKMKKRNLNMMVYWKVWNSHIEEAAAIMTSLTDIRRWDPIIFDACLNTVRHGDDVRDENVQKAVVVIRKLCFHI